MQIELFQSGQSLYAELFVKDVTNYNNSSSISILQHFVIKNGFISR